MNGQDPSQRDGPYGSPPGRFDFGNIIGDPFALASISIAALAWLVTLIGTAIASATAEEKKKPANFTFWAIAYAFCCVGGVAVALLYNTWHRYQLAIVAYLSAALVFTSSAANALIYQKEAASEAAGAGHILLSMVTIVWIFYFGRTLENHSYAGNYSMNQDQKRFPSARFSGYGRPDTSASSHQAPQMYTSAQLGGNFETSSPMNRGLGEGSKYLSGTTPPASTPTPGPSVSPQPQSNIPPEPEVSVPTEYPYKAKAIYAYEANPEDANEISFSKGEILDVSDVSGRWWQARKTTGETGIAPSNYLVLL